MGKERNCTKSKKIRNSFTKLTYNLLARRWSTKLFIIYNFAAGNYHVRDHVETWDCKYNKSRHPKRNGILYYEIKYLCLDIQNLVTLKVV